jgi:clan AA aspartic protease
MLGTFHNDQPKIEIELSGTSENTKKVTALVDSGFNGYLTLPYQDAFPLGLILIGIQSNTLADGSTSSHFVCMGSVCVDGKCINTTIDIQPANIVLLGTKLLKELGKTFILDCSIGKVEIVDSGRVGERAQTE